MALIVEDGTGLSTADSYASVSFADDFHLSRDNQVWGTLSQSRKESLMRQATDYITYIFGNIFIGQKAYVGQSLVWPRYRAIPFNGVYLLSLGVPKAIKEATAELALAAQSGPLTPNQESRSKKRVKVGPIDIEYDGNSFSAKRFVSATARLSTFLNPISNSFTARLVRT